MSQKRSKSWLSRSLASCLNFCLPCLPYPALSSSRQKTRQQRESCRPFGVCTSVQLVKRHPSLLTPTVAMYPAKVMTLLRNCNREAVFVLCDIACQEDVAKVLKELVRNVELPVLRDRVGALLSDQRQAPALASLLGALNPGTLVTLVKAVPAEKLRIVLSAPPDKLAPLVQGLDASSVVPVLIPILTEPNEVLRDKVLPLLERTRHVLRITAAINHGDGTVLLWLLRAVEGEQLAALLNVLSDEDFEETGSVIALLKLFAGELDILTDKVAPLISSIDPEKLSALIRQVSAPRLLEMMRRVEVDGLQRLLDCANIDFVVASFIGPLEPAVGAVAGKLAKVLANPTAARIFRHSSHALGPRLAKTSKTIQDCQTSILRARETGGAGRLVSSAMERWSQTARHGADFAVALSQAAEAFAGHWETAEQDFVAAWEHMALTFRGAIDSVPSCHQTQEMLGGELLLEIPLRRNQNNQLCRVSESSERVDT